MKKHIFLFACIMLFMLIPAKSQSEWAPVGAKWTYTQTFYFSSRIDTLVIRSIGDTIIHGKNCKILKRNKLNCDLRPMYEYMYSESGKVYYYDIQIDLFQMLYNFNAAAGESWTIYPGEPQTDDSIEITVDSVSTVNINSIDLIKLYVHSSAPNLGWVAMSSGVIIENIGDSYSMFPWDYGACDASWGGPLRCYQDSIIGLYNFETAPDCDYTLTSIDEYENPLSITVYPNPAKDWAAFDYTLPENANNATLIITDAFGKTIAHFVLSGIQGQQLWDTRGIVAGTYIYTLKVNGSSKTGKIVINK